jgi:hypothetical protein
MRLGVRRTGIGGVVAELSCMVSAGLLGDPELTPSGEASHKVGSSRYPVLKTAISPVDIMRLCTGRLGDSKRLRPALNLS